MNLKWRPIARTLLRTGPLVAAMTSPRDLFRVALRADANDIAVARGEPSFDVELTARDRAALKRFGETAAISAFSSWITSSSAHGATYADCSSIRGGKMVRIKETGLSAQILLKT
jgi:DNA repair proteins